LQNGRKEAQEAQKGLKMPTFLRFLRLFAADFRILQEDQ
jgi:hypothetical protein